VFLGSQPFWVEKSLPRWSTQKLPNSLCLAQTRWSHGVSPLAQLLISHGFQPKKSQAVDLCLTDSEGAITVLFEAKTDSDQYSIYTPVGL
jgi:hypothetical protein